MVASWTRLLMQRARGWPRQLRHGLARVFLRILVVHGGANVAAHLFSQAWPAAVGRRHRLIVLAASRVRLLINRRHLRRVWLRCIPRQVSETRHGRTKEMMGRLGAGGLIEWKKFFSLGSDRRTDRQTAANTTRARHFTQTLASVGRLHVA